MLESCKSRSAIGGGSIGSRRNQERSLNGIDGDRATEPLRAADAATQDALRPPASP